MTRQRQWLDPVPWVDMAQHADEAAVEHAIMSSDPGLREFACLISPAADAHLEAMAARAQMLTRRHFGRTVSLYVPLYVSNYCPGGCAYCGFASDREQPRRKLEPGELRSELATLHEMGFEEVLLLTGERAPEAGFEYVHDCVCEAARLFHKVTVESFAMDEDEYRRLSDAGCTGITLYQETYDAGLYGQIHQWGPKRNYDFRLEAPARALAGGMRTVGLGALLGLADPLSDSVALMQHLRHLERDFWQGGFTLSFPRVRPQRGDFHAEHPVDDRLLARIVFAFRICLPDVPLVLSTREGPHFRDGMAGIGISKMSVASRTTVGGYHEHADRTGGQFSVSDTRSVTDFCEALKAKGLDPVFKNWDATLR